MSSVNSLIKRYSDQTFPPYTHKPGVTVHPNKPGGHLEQSGEPKASTENAQELFFFGIDLFNFEYFWESHIYFEALWHFEGRKNGEADFLKALIKFSAAGVKQEMDSLEASLGHFQRGIELLERRETPESYRGLFKDDILSVESLDKLKFILRERRD